MMSEPVMSNVDVSSAVLILGVLKEGESALIVTIEVSGGGGDLDVGMDVEQELLEPTYILTGFRARSVFRLSGGQGWSVVILLLATPTNGPKIIDEAARE